ncbi:MAG: hypothetical protein OJF59_000663 [Cytophagales bacterium]|nr:DUF4468 domain-containing protein [Bacteroidota bacterium]MBS1979657.1 DUF4468 domain-containing protein [Bacteroidota bacterium]WHZ06910.1 MAG: hypothetical protein OJF59_000663 [Cytophagales bacterium]
MIKPSFIFILIFSVTRINVEAQLVAGSSVSQEVKFENVVLADSLTKSQLFKNAMAWIRKLDQNDEHFDLKLKDSIDGKMNGLCSFFVYSQNGILKKISGTVSYDLSIDVKDKKYRYQFNHFLFHYYKQDRYYNMVATGKVKSLQEIKAPGWQRLWTSHRLNTINKMIVNCRQLELQMNVKEKKISNKIQKEVEW